jgi:threonine/homoserine/homoserine lactone efflux protein
MILALLIGTLFGFFGAIPVAGPISALIVRFGLQGRERDGRLLALGAAVAESFYVFLACLGYATLLQAFPLVDRLARTLASLLLTGLGLYFVLRSKRLMSTGTETPSRNGSPFGVGFLVSILNPTLMVTWTVVLAWVHGWRVIELGPVESLSFSAGAGFGIVLWFTAMLRWLARSGGALQEPTLIRLIRGTGWVLIALGLHGFRFLWFAGL